LRGLENNALGGERVPGPKGVRGTHEDFLLGKIKKKKTKIPLGGAKTFLKRGDLEERPASKDD